MGDPLGQLSLLDALAPAERKELLPEAAALWAPSARAPEDAALDALWVATVELAEGEFLAAGITDLDAALAWAQEVMLELPLGEPAVVVRGLVARWRTEHR